jgi:hypothetical protein
MNIGVSIFPFSRSLIFKFLIASRIICVTNPVRCKFSESLRPNRCLLSTLNQRSQDVSNNLNKDPLPRIQNDPLSELAHRICRSARTACQKSGRQNSFSRRIPTCWDLCFTKSAVGINSYVAFLSIDKHIRIGYACSTYSFPWRIELTLY